MVFVRSVTGFKVAFINELAVRTTVEKLGDAQLQCTHNTHHLNNDRPPHNFRLL